MAKELVIYCDESLSKGTYFGDFYGGVIISSENLESVESTLENAKSTLGLTGEMKWNKISATDFERYIEFISIFFGFIKDGTVKARIQFTPRAHQIDINTVPQKNRDVKFFLLYYQFIKWAFGLKHSSTSESPTRVRIYFDELPDSQAKCVEFKDYICRIPSTQDYSNSGIFITPNDLYEVDSKKHILLQCIDIVLGSMQFRLNDQHKAKPEGQKRRGKKTVAKEKVYKHINSQIRDIYPNFNIGKSTSDQGDVTNRWHHPYRHWEFIPNGGVYDETATKAANRK